MCVGAHYEYEVCYDNVSSGIIFCGLSDASVGPRLFSEHGLPRAKVDKVNHGMFDVNWSWLLSSHCFVLHLLLKATILQLYRVAMTTSFWWSRGSALNPLNSMHYINVHGRQHQMHTVTAINKGFANWLVLLIRCSAMGLMIMPFICVAQNNDGLPFDIYFIPILNQIR